ncbi:hypothetical protein [Spirillospora sp. NBC_01491]|uniref:hypothetical protein n=1 Tax=Spirillospora sp. NBC_01491 TaxID=2976007 RepID=UPI002E37BC3F|nr:hypothetical protein [Spirillospora sp. NBC_01491]
MAIVDVDGRTEHSGEPPLTGWEAEVLERWWRVARFDDEAVRREFAADRLVALSRSRFFTGLPPEDLIRTVRAMMSGPTAGDHRAVREALAPETRAVVGFGLGAVAAVDVLARRPAVPREAVTLITVGSPLAWRHGPARPRVREWINLADVGDGLAGGEGLAPYHGEDVHDMVMDCDPRLRAPRPYIASPEFGRALLRAFDTAGSGLGRRDGA